MDGCARVLLHSLGTENVGLHISPGLEQLLGPSTGEATDLHLYGSRSPKLLQKGHEDLAAAIPDNRTEYQLQKVCIAAPELTSGLSGTLYLLFLAEFSAPSPSNQEGEVNFTLRVISVENVLDHFENWEHC